jgi:hypothetical protein
MTQPASSSTPNLFIVEFGKIVGTRKPRRGGYILSIAHRLWHKNLTEIYGVEAARFGCWNRNTISGPAANTIAAVACFTSYRNLTFDLEWL